MLIATSAIANGGIAVKPSIVRNNGQHGGQHGHNDGQRGDFQPADAGEAVMARESRRIVSVQTAARMQRLMEGVVRNGTAKLAKPAGYTAAGKTGTAQKLDRATGTYSVRDHIASFVGYTPAEAPMFAIIVVVDSPRGKYHGGDLAAPVFRKIAEQALAYRNVPSEEPQPPVSLASRQAKALPKEKPSSVAGNATQFREGEPGLIVPDFVGQGVRFVTTQALENRLPIQIEGNGVAYEQSPEPGTMLPAGERIVIRFRIGGHGRPERPQLENSPRTPSPGPSAAAAALPASG
jgi:cell division protein FtsI (penicillin-binding protein 3)